MAYHPFTEQGHKCPECGSRSICTMEDGYCETRGACDNCIKDEYMRRFEFDKLRDHDPDHDD